MSAPQYVFVDDDDLDADALIDGRRIGYVWCVRDGDRLKVSDLEIQDAMRGKGYGSALLRFVLARADAEGVREVWGLVTADDIQRTPQLLDLYVRHGFTASDTDKENDPDLKGCPPAVKKIVRRR